MSAPRRNWPRKSASSPATRRAIRRCLRQRWGRAAERRVRWLQRCSAGLAPAPDGAGRTLTRSAISSAASSIKMPPARNTPAMPLKLNIAPPAAAPAAIEDCTEATTIPPALSA
ncbi:hypothetical protein G6F68_017384 [Rhizopus microsporus]|nr:hypothetical protein G6F68_017384 [Rhizopus microsporus]